MSKEAMKLALEALEYIEHNYMSLPAPAEKAITALREALAQQALDKKAENARELGLDYEPAITALREALAEQPAQQEPVACQYAQDVAMPEYRCIGRCQYDTSPPAQRKPQSVKVWDAEGYGALCQELEGWKAKAKQEPVPNNSLQSLKLSIDDWLTLFEAIEEKHRSKNEDRN